MPNKDRQKRSVRQARAREREALEAAQAAASAPATSGKRGSAKSTPAKSEAKKDVAKKDGFFARAKTYFHDVRIEMHRVVWPSKAELKNYSIACIAMLLVAGIAIWLVDTGFVGILLGLTGLRG